MCVTIWSVLQGLKNQVEGIATLHDDTLKIANESRTLAKATYLEALAISTDASSIAIPRIDAAELKAEGESCHSCIKSHYGFIIVGFKMKLKKMQHTLTFNLIVQYVSWKEFSVQTSATFTRLDLL